MSLITRLTLPAIAAAALLASPAHAVIASPTLTTYYFSGACTDCTGTDTGTLVLSNYTPGTEFGSANFVSFQFNGSNLYPAFTISSPNYFVDGTISAQLPSIGTLYTYDSNNFFF